MVNAEYYNLGRKKIYGFLIMMGGIVFMSVFTSLMYSEYYYNNLITYDNLTIYLSMVSLGFAFFIYGVTFNSNVNMALLTNDRFADILDSFENEKIDLVNDSGKVIRACWKCRRYMERAVELMRVAKIQPYLQNALFEQVVQLVLMSNIQWWQPNIRIEEIENVIKICQYACFLDLEQEKKEELQSFIPYMEIFNSTLWEMTGYFFWRIDQT